MSGEVSLVRQSATAFAVGGVATAGVIGISVLVLYLLKVGHYGAPWEKTWDFVSNNRGIVCGTVAASVGSIALGTFLVMYVRNGSVRKEKIIENNAPILEVDALIPEDASETDKKVIRYLDHKFQGSAVLAERLKRKGRGPVSINREDLLCLMGIEYYQERRRRLEECKGTFLAELDRQREAVKRETKKYNKAQIEWGAIRWSLRRLKELRGQQGILEAYREERIDEDEEEMRQNPLPPPSQAIDMPDEDFFERASYDPEIRKHEVQDADVEAYLERKFNGKLFSEERQLKGENSLMLKCQRQELLREINCVRMHCTHECSKAQEYEVKTRDQAYNAYTQAGKLNIEFLERRTNALQKLVENLEGQAQMARVRSAQQERLANPKQA